MFKLGLNEYKFTFIDFYGDYITFSRFMWWFKEWNMDNIYSLYAIDYI